MKELHPDTVWSWLEEVPDPEIPVITIVDLGMVRNVEVSDNKAIVTITPTYSGCPATDVIPKMIEEKLHEKGLHRLEIKSKIAPPWTTDWISEKGKEKLKAFGIAPPVEQTSDKSFIAGRQKAVPCPFCDSVKTKMVSRFGSTPCKAAYQCQDCLEPFDYFKCH